MGRGVQEVGTLGARGRLGPQGVGSWDPKVQVAQPELVPQLAGNTTNWTLWPG